MSKVKPSLLIICFSLLILHTCIGYNQQIVLYDDYTPQSNFFTFRKHIPDLTTCYSHPAVICTTGFWVGFPNKEFEGPSMNIHGMNESAECFNTSSTTIKSLRFGGHSDTTVDGISMYPEEGFEGKEHFISGLASGLLSAKSFIYTGITEWLLYEEQDFQGKFLCTKFHQDYMELGVFGHTNVTESLDLKQVGSIIRGCDVLTRNQIIDEYMTKRNNES